MRDREREREREREGEEDREASSRVSATRIRGLRRRDQTSRD